MVLWLFLFLTLSVFASFFKTASWNCIWCSFPPQHPGNQSVSTCCPWITYRVESTASVPWLEVNPFEQFCTSFFCLFLIRIYTVQVLKQALEQELFLPVKWVWVKCSFNHPGASHTKSLKKPKCWVCASWHLSAVTGLSHLFSPPRFCPIFFLHSRSSLLIPDGWRNESADETLLERILHLDGMVFAATVCF